MRGTFLVLKKELIEFSKDRKTLLFLAMPIVLYPVLFSMMNRLGQRDEEQRKANPSRIVLVDPGSVVKPVLEKDPKLFTLVEAPKDLPKAIADDQIDLKVEVASNAEALAKDSKPFTLAASYDKNVSGSREAMKRLDEALEAERGRMLERRFESLGGRAEMATPFHLEKADVGEIGRTISRILGSFLPYVLLITMYAGAMQHGAYMSAGERERGTLMSLLATRLPRRDIILGKQLALFTLSILTALLNLGGMAFGMGRLILQEGASGAAKGTAAAAVSMGALADPKTLLLTLFLLIPLGLFFTAIVMLVGIQAKNTREAATALTPGIFIVVLLGVFSSAPGVEKMAALPWVPVLNVSVAIRKLFAQQMVTWEYLVAFGMTVALAAGLTALATKILNRESALFKA